MAPSAGHLHKLVVKNIKLIKTAWQKTTHLVQAKIPLSLRPASVELHTVPVRTARQALHPVAYLRQSQSRWYTTRSTFSAAVRRFTTASGQASGLKYNRSSFPKSRVGTIVNGLTGRAPFASTLRPNLTGGTLGRTAGGYSLGSGRAGAARYFSHSPVAPGQVVQNVSQAVRAFWLSGQKAQYDGKNQHTGEKRYRAVSALQETTSRKMHALPKATPGSYIDFSVNPTITALTPLNIVAGYASSIIDGKPSYPENTLNAEGLLDILSIDFSRALKDLAAILNDLKNLAILGDLPISCPSPSLLRVHFPGCDAETVEKLCREMGVTRGLVSQDADFDAFVGTEIALLFPLAPSDSMCDDDVESAAQWFERRPQEMVDWHGLLSRAETVTLPSDEFSTRSETGEDFDIIPENVWLSDGSSPEGYESMHTPSDEMHEQSDPLEYQGFEGIYRFMEMCNTVRA